MPGSPLLYLLMSIPYIILYVMLFRHFLFGNFLATFLYIVIIGAGLNVAHLLIGAHDNAGILLIMAFFALNALLFGVTYLVFSWIKRILLRQNGAAPLKLPMFLSVELKRKYMKRYKGADEGESDDE